MELVTWAMDSWVVLKYEKGNLARPHSELS